MRKFYPQLFRMLSKVLMTAALVRAPVSFANPASPGQMPELNLAEGEPFLLYLTDFPAMDWQVRKNTNAGSFDVNLRNDAAPGTVRNFLNYVVNGAYTLGMVHRSVPGFVIQGGGFHLTGTQNDFSVSPIPNDGEIPGEFQLLNRRGTMAMALVGGNPNSGTTQWFININDNPNLDNPASGPFTVFGEVIPPGMNVVDAINNLPRVNFGGAFSETPMRFYDPNGEVEIQDFVRIPSVDLLNPPQLVRVQPESRVRAHLEGHRLTLESLTDTAGVAEVALRFRRQGNWVEESIRLVNGVDLGGFGYGLPVSGNRFLSPVYGEIDRSNSTTAFSRSLQAPLNVSQGTVRSPVLGHLTPNPWGIDHWVVSEFFGLMHFGATESQYAGWISSERFGWMRFVEDPGGSRFLWVHRLQSWFAVNPDGSFHSFDFGRLAPENGSLTRYNSRIGILIDDDQNPPGWLRSDRFGFVWFARDGTGTWFWSSIRNEWIGITPQGGLWSTAEGRFI